MRKTIVLIALVLAAVPALGVADEFLEAPVLSGGTPLVTLEDRLETMYELTCPEVVDFYKESLKDQQDIKFRDRGTFTIIEDQGNRPWRSITIIRTDDLTVKVVIVKDDWTWILGTLGLRFVGVLVVLGILYGAMAISGAIISRMVPEQTASTS